MPTFLPPLTAPFVGRHEELARITALLADPNCRLLALLGPGGIGKTSLAIQAAAQAAELFISVTTVKKHVNHIFAKLGVGSRAKAIVAARSLHLS